MTMRRKPILKLDDVVKIYRPTAEVGKGRYYRILYPYNGGFRETTATTENAALVKAHRIAKKIKNGGDLRCELTVNDFLDAYLDSNLREKSGNVWGPKHALARKGLMNLYVRPAIGTKLCTEITNDLLKEIVWSGGTVSNGEHLRSAIGAWIRWGKGEKWVVSDPLELLQGLKNTTNQMRTETKARQSGQGILYINPDQIPSHSEVDALAKAAAANTGIWWYELMFNLAAYSGMRIGEILDLDVTHIDTKAKTIQVLMQCLEVGGRKMRVLPKMSKQRTTIYPTKTPSGYPLAKQMERRIKELKALKKVPLIQDGTRRLLLFHNRTGGWISQGSFAKNVRLPAQDKAGWPKDQSGRFIWTFHSLRHVFCSYYLGELRQEASDVAIAVGHSSPWTTYSMYVGAAKTAISKLSAAN